MYRLALGLLPRWLRREAGDEMLAAAREGAVAAGDRGRWALVTHWLRETTGVLVAAVAARRPDRWTRRTDPVTRRGMRNANDGDGSMSGFVHTVGAAARSLGRRPSLVVLTGLTLSLGIGASTAMFSVVQSVLLRPLPFPQPEELVAVYPGWPSMRDHPTMGRMADRGSWSWPEFFGVAEVQEVFRDFAAFDLSGATLTGEGPAQRVATGRASWQLFPMLGLTPAAGRLFQGQDDRSDRLVVLSHGAWRDRFGGDPTAVGRSVVLNDEAHQILGVLPAGFDVAGLDQAEFWLLMTGSVTDPGVGNHGSTRAIGRLGEAVGIERARDEITAAFGSVLPVNHGEHIGSVYPLQDDLTQGSRGSILIMLGASMLLLLVAFTNAAALLLGAGIDRARELALRGALGASRWRIAQQLLAESALLGLVSVLGGVAASIGLTRLLLAIAPTAVPGLERAALDPTVLLFAASSAFVFGGFFGLVPALSSSSVDLAGSIGTARSQTGRKTRLYNAIVAAQLGLATVLVVSGTLLVRTVSALDSTDPGFDHERLAVVAVAVPWQRFRDAEGEADETAAGAYQRELLENLEAVPGVVGAAVTSTPPFSSWRGNNSVWPEDWDASRGDVFAERRFVTPDFFDVMGVEILEGRSFDISHMQEDAAPVVVISEGLAELGWPNGNAVGSVLSYWGREASVLGVARNLRDHDVDEVTELAFYAPGEEGPILLRIDGDPAELVPALTARVRSFDEDLPIMLAESLPDLIAESTASERYRARLMSVFACLSAFLALLGTYGVTSRAVSRRTREIGVRVAIGAARTSVWRLITAQALFLGVAGAVSGAVGSLAAGGVIASFLYGVTPTDPVTYILVLTLVPGATVLAAVMPARRAMKIDPTEALRRD